MVFILAVVSITFCYYFDAAYIHLSTLNLVPAQVAFVSSLAAAGVLVAVRRIDCVSEVRNAEQDKD